MLKSLPFSVKAGAVGLILRSILIIPAVWAQTSSLDTIPQALPFPISEQKRMPDAELEHKRSGTFLTGLPQFEYDPIRGFGAGGTINLFFNGTRQDPLFPYTPYRHRVTAGLFYFQNGRFRYAINYDAPYIFNTQWRVRADIVSWEDPNAQYWGLGRDRQLRDLRFVDKRTDEVRMFRRVRDYERNLDIATTDPDGQLRTDHHFHHMEQRERLYNLLLERTLLEGRLRVMFGFEALFTSFTSYQGRIADQARTLTGEEVEVPNRETLVDIERRNGTWDRYNLQGFTNGDNFRFTSMLAGALIYDTRDFEPDPSQGVLLQYSHEYSAPWVGSQFNFNKGMVQTQLFTTPIKWRGGRSRVTLAGLAALGHIWGPRINFIEMWDLSSQAEAGGILVLGGARSLRGYREARFLAPTVGLVNLEVRTRLYDFDLLRQHFSVGLTPFYDMGSVFESLDDLTLRDWRGSTGIGARIGWNLSTILRLDYGVSREGGQVFFSFGHIF